MKTVSILILSIILFSCNNPKSNNTVTVEKAEKKMTNDVTGKWISINDYIVKDLVITTYDSETYNFKINYKDGGIQYQETKLNSKGEYHTNNKFGEYYKFNGKTLVIFDKQGMIAYYER